MVEFKGFTRDETLGLYRRARVFVDLHHPGRELSNYEFALFDAIPLILPLINGGDEVGFASVRRLRPATTIRSFIYLLIRPFIHSCINAFISMHPTMHSFIHSYPFMH